MAQPSVGHVLQKPRDLTAKGSLPEEDAASKRQVNRLHKSRPSDLSYMKRRHHLEWHRFRNLRTPYWRRRRHRLEDVGVRVTRPIGSTSTTLVYFLDCRFVSHPPLMEMTTRRVAFAEVVVVLAADPSHDLFEAGQLVLQVLQGIMENVDLGVLLPNHFTKVATLTRS